jgi:uncharacterized repeat protein (TIGR01451 family)
MARLIVKRYIFPLVALTLTLFPASSAFAQASLSIGLTVSPPSEVDAQGRQTYTATVTNSGSSNANNLVLMVTLPNIDLPISSTPSSCVFAYNGPLFATCSLGTLAAGSNTTAEVVVYPTNVGDLFVNADASESGGATATTQVGSVVTGVGIADVMVTLTANPNPAQVGSPLTYILNAFNIGDDDAQGVVVNLVLPSNATFVSASTGCTRAGALVSCKAGHMVVSGSRNFKIVVTPTVSGWTFATGLLRAETVADPSTLNDSSVSRIWVNP